jgi:colanic acid biosynthesis glycosyl transferase WcaI
MWLQDILPDGAAISGLLDEQRLGVRLARRFEHAAYASAARVIVISETFRANLVAKGVPNARIVRIFNPASRSVADAPRSTESIDPCLALNMGNIGYSQNLVAVVRAFEASDDLAALGARLVMAGDGVAGADVRAAIMTDRAEVTGILRPEQLGPLIERAAVGVVTQQPRDNDFNVPSKLMNFMGAGVPVIASVEPDSEVARIVRESGGGWLTSSSDLGELTGALVDALNNPAERARRGAAALRFARDNFDAKLVAERFEQALLDVV